jgi:N-acetylmuramoyl-L-alanine amidase
VSVLTFVPASGCGESASPPQSFFTSPTQSVATTDSPITSTSADGQQPTSTTTATTTATATAAATRATAVKPSATTSLVVTLARPTTTTSIAAPAKPSTTTSVVVTSTQPTTTTSIAAPAKPSGPTTLVLTNGQTPLKGKWSGTAEQLASYLLGVCPSPSFSVTTSVLAGYYVRYCAEAGLRADLLWAQMIHETGYGMYGGDVLPGQNNYAGIGATGGGNPGHSFPTAEAGVRAQVAHMVAYVYVDSPVSWANATTDPRFDLVWPRGAVSVLADLNGRWAFPGTTYGQKIEAIARKINSN